ncbi:MAG TPA: hypothetical protein PK599_07040, partial [bacterium]|nr:hypothetical protein [bacterium]
MNQVDKLKKLNKFSYFDMNTLSQIIDISQNSLYSNVKRWLKNAKLIQLKKGFYVTGEYFNNNFKKDSYFEFVANKLCEPSYLSGEYVLQQYNILSEAVYAMTSVTLKGKREYKNNLGRFIYRNIKDDLFDGYVIVEKDGFQIKIATKAKALFDYLYLKFYRIKNIDSKKLDSLRLNLEGFSKKDLKEFSKYCEMTGITKFKLLP